MATKARNEHGRLRFKNLHSRKAAVDVDIVHRVKGKLHGEDAAPQTGEMGSHLQDELETCKDLDLSKELRQFYYVLWPLVQSLPEVLHHQQEIVNLLCERLQTVPVETLPSFLKLVAVFAKDLGPEMGKHFHALFGVLSKRLGAIAVDEDGHLRPELAGQAIECLSYLLKYQLSQLAEDPDCMRQYYGDMLGSPAEFVRDLSAKCLSMLLRKLATKVFTKHIKKIFKAIAINCTSMVPAEALRAIGIGEGGSGIDGSGGLQLRVAALETPESESTGHPHISATKRMHYLINGIRYLLFHTMKGVKGCIHSNGLPKFEAVLEMIFPLPGETLRSLADSLNKDTPADSTDMKNGSGRAAKKADKRKAVYAATASLKTLNLSDKQVLALQELNEDALVTAYVNAQVASQSFVALFRHIHPSNSAELWILLMEVIERARHCMALYFGVHDLPPKAGTAIKLFVAHCLEMCIFSISHSQYRGLSDQDVKNAVGKKLISSAMGLVTAVLYNCGDDTARQSSLLQGFGHIIERSRMLLCHLWIAFSTHEKMLTEVNAALSFEVTALHPSPAVLVFTAQLFHVLPDEIIENHFL